MKFSVSAGRFDCDCGVCSGGQTVDESEIPPLPPFNGNESREEVNNALCEWKASLPEGVEPADVLAANRRDGHDDGHRPEGVFASESSSSLDGAGRPSGVVTNSSSDRPTGVMSRDTSDDSNESGEGASERPQKRAGVNYRGLDVNTSRDEQGGVRAEDDGWRPDPVLTRSGSEENRR